MYLLNQLFHPSVQRTFSATFFRELHSKLISQILKLYLFSRTFISWTNDFDRLFLFVSQRPVNKLEVISLYFIELRKESFEKIDSSSKVNIFKLLSIFDIWHSLWIPSICRIILFWQIFMKSLVSLFITVVSRAYVNCDRQ